jgi:enoyl-CoA hydratase
MDYVSVKVENHICTVTMDKQPGNTFNRQFYHEIRDTFSSVGEKEDVWVVVFRAEGKHFCTGNDVKEFTGIASPEAGLEYGRMVGESIGSVYECAVPVIGAVNGLALGTGLALAGCCDILVAAENARFGIPEIRVGIVGAACFISRMLPQQLHRYMSYSGDIMTAAEMKHYGALLKIVPNDQLLSAAMEVADHIIQNPPLALRGFKAAMNQNEDARLKEKYAVEVGYGRKFMFESEDMREAFSAFLEKRKPAFKGK